MKRHAPGACLLLGLTQAALPALVGADESRELKSTLVLPEIVVVGKRMAQAPAITFHETTALDFAAWNATTAADALTRTPGVNVQYGADSGEARAWIRGFRDRSVLVLFDGIPVASASGLDMAGLIGGLIADGLDPDEVAGLVVDAVHHRRFYILTHDEWLPGVTARTERMVNGQDPAMLLPN